MGQETEIRRLRGFGDTTVALLTRGEGPGATAAAPLPECALTFESQGDGGLRWRVRRFEVTEGLSALYECALDLAADNLAENPDALLGRYALLQVQRDTVTRRFYGLVRRVEHRGTTATHRMARVYTVPALWTLSQRSDARVFQAMTAVEVVQAVLQDAGLYAGMLDVQLQRQYPVREYCVQHRETDLAFVTRLLESEGVTFFFRHEDESETLVLTDGPQAYGAVRTMDGGPVPIAGAEMSTLRVEAVRHLVWERELRPTGVAVRDFDFTRPDYRIERMAPRRREGDRNLYDPAPALTLGAYRDVAYTDEDGDEQARLRHEAERVRGAVGRGDGVVVGMSPGALFQLTLAGAHVPQQRYLVTRVEHTGDAPEVFAVDAQAQRPDEDRYRNRFECIPLEVPFRPPRATPRPVIAGLQTAVVTGPAGEEVYADEHGRIKVQFHWDRYGARDEHTTAWLRVMQGPWAGNGWGFQFLPRVGMEVAVSFVEGDPDRPVIVGALYNGHHRPPFPLPEEKSRSGIKTQSTPGGAGHNELRFEDRAGAEEVYLHAQRDLLEVVLSDRRREVGHDEAVRVSSDQSVTVERDRAVRVTHDQLHEVGGDDRVTVLGMSTTTVQDDRIVRVGGHQVTVVGAHDARRSSTLHVEGASHFTSTETTEVRSDSDILLRCGRSMIRLTPSRIELVSPDVIVRGGENRVAIGGTRIRLRAESEAVVAADRVVVKASGASVRLQSDAEVMGSRVKLGTSPVPLDDDPSETSRVTTIELRDDQGRPIPHQRFVILMGDGTEQTGVVNAEGRARVELDADARVVFPDLGRVEKG